MAGTVQGVDLITRSGGPSFGCTLQMFDSSFHVFGGGMSFESPFGAPAAVQRRIVSISASLSDRSFLNRRMPTVLSMCHGGIWRAPMRAAIDFTQGRASSYVTSDI